MSPRRLSALCGGWVLVICSFLFAASAEADDFWSAVSGDWLNAANWRLAIPTSSDDAYIVNGGTANVTAAGAAANNLCLGGTGGGTVQVSGGTLTIGSSAYIGAGGTGAVGQSGGLVSLVNTSSSAAIYLGYDPGSLGSYNLGGGLLTAPCEWLGYQGGASFVQTGGTNAAANQVVINWNSTSPVSYTLEGSGLLSTGNEWLGMGGSASFTQSGGTHTTSGYLFMDAASYYLNSGLLSVGADEYVGFGQTAVFTHSGGTNQVLNGSGIIVGASGGNGIYNLTGPGLLSVPSAVVGWSATGSLTLGAGTASVSTAFSLGVQGGGGSCTLSPGATLSVAGTEYLGLSGTGTFTQNGGSQSVAVLCLGFQPGAAGTYNLSGGTLSVSQLIQAGSGTAALNLNGGTLRAGGMLSTSVPISLATGGGNATIDTNGYSMTFAGPLSGPGGLVKVGTGTLTLAASNTYSGGTTIAAGFLTLANSAALLNSTLDTSGGGSLSFGGLTAATLGGLAGSNGLALANTAGLPVVLTVGGNGASTTFNALLGTHGSLVKVGTGTLTFTGKSTYWGSTTISGGDIVALGFGVLSPYSDMLVSGLLDTSTYANAVKSLTITSGGALNLGIGNLLTSVGPASLGGILNLSGTAGSSPIELLGYGSETGSFAGVTGLPAGYTLQYRSTELDLVLAPEPSTWALFVAAAGPGAVLLRRRWRSRAA
jgi:autotransporter-associated beta strand protein